MTSKNANRKRPTFSITLSQSMKSEVSRAAEKLGVPVSRVIERALAEYLSKIRKRTDIEGKEELVVERKDESIEERYMRSKIFDMKNNWEWQQVM